MNKFDDDFNGSSPNLPQRSNVEQYTVDGKTWFALKQENWVPDRQQFVLDCWVKDFPETSISDYDELTRFISRSAFLNDWYLSVISKYRQIVSLPIHVQDILPVSDYERACSKIKDINDWNASKSEELERASVEYKEKIQKINKTYQKIDDAKVNDPIVFILTLNTNMLPLGILHRIDKYVPRDASDPITGTIYAREQLLEYQRYLIDKHLAGDDVYKIVEEQRQNFVDPLS